MKNLFGPTHEKQVQRLKDKYNIALNAWKQMLGVNQSDHVPHPTRDYDKLNQALKAAQNNMALEHGDVKAWDNMINCSGELQDAALDLKEFVADNSTKLSSELSFTAVGYANDADSTVKILNILIAESQAALTTQQKTDIIAKAEGNTEGGRKKRKSKKVKKSKKPKRSRRGKKQIKKTKKYKKRSNKKI